MWGQPSTKVLQYQRNTAMPQYFWYDDPQNGVYKLCKGNKETYEVKFEEFNPDMTQPPEEEALHQLGKTRFAWTGTIGGKHHCFTPLKACTVEDAKTELEAIYETLLQRAVTEAQNTLNTLQNEYRSFLAAKERKS